MNASSSTDATISEEKSFLANPFPLLSDCDSKNYRLKQLYTVHQGHNAAWNEVLKKLPVSMVLKSNCTVGSEILGKMPFIS